MNRLTLIGGPCVIESEDLVMDLAGRIKDITSKLNIDYYFKASFDKARAYRVSADRAWKKGLLFWKK